MQSGNVYESFSKTRTTSSTSYDQHFINILTTQITHFVPIKELSAA